MYWMHRLKFQQMRNTKYNKHQCMYLLLKHRLFLQSFMFIILSDLFIILHMKYGLLTSVEQIDTEELDWHRNSYFYVYWKYNLKMR